MDLRPSNSFFSHEPMTPPVVTHPFAPLAPGEPHVR